MKPCRTCGKIKPLSEYPKRARSSDGRNIHCKKCCAKKTRTWRENNPVAAKKSVDRYRRSNPEKVDGWVRKYRAKDRQAHLDRQRKASTKWRSKNKERVALAKKRWAEKNSDKCAEKAARRRAVQQHATPWWLTESHKAEIKRIYEEAKKNSEKSGHNFHVDHVVPLNGSVVCGLHVPWNLRVVPARENQKKWSHLPEDPSEYVALRQ